MKIEKYSTIQTEINKDILTITLNRPDKKNSLNKVLINELTDVLNRSKKIDEIFGVILTGAGDVFCSGADLEYLKSLLEFGYEDSLKETQILKDLYYMIYSYPKPTLALVNGAAIAGGCGLMSVCDFVIASDKAIFGYPEVKIGFVAAIVSIFLVQTISYRMAKELLLSGEIIDAQKAKTIGLINKVVPEGELKNVGSEFITKFKNNSITSLKLTKNLLNKISFRNIEEILNEACVFNARSRQEPDFKEGILSFLEKRKPRWAID